MPTIKDAYGVFGKIINMNEFNYSIPVFSLLLIMIVFLKDVVDELDIKSLKFLHHKYFMIRWITYIVLICSICISGVYGGQFIYSGF